mmetsp:Transcript_10536/g.38770  ORF Transcript_10536/g.38770 Transcript_10536/m.38770 type:complete len:127 (+) Transcript_10536:158-538(+)
MSSLNVGRLLNADVGHGVTQAYHASSFALAGAVPAGMMTSKGSYFNVPIDLALTVALPVHSHIACNFVISDYVPHAARGVARAGVLGVSAVMFLGLAKLTVTSGVVNTVKLLWEKPPPKEAPPATK